MKIKTRSACAVLFSCILPLALATSVHGAVTLEWVTVGDPNNANDSTGYGGVGYEYQIMKYEVTNAQYAEFLNAKAATATSENGENDLYNTSMGTDARGGITRSGVSGSYTYSVKTPYADMPVVYVSHLDAQRFANWMHNGQGAGDTETGAYAVGSLSVHSGVAQYWIPTEDEWFKAAYYEPASVGGDTDNYWLYPTRSNAQPTSTTAPSAIARAANYKFDDGIANGINGGYATTHSSQYLDTTNYLSNVGAYSNSSSYYGTFDQGGNVYEWDETIIAGGRGLRGGAWNRSESAQQASLRLSTNLPSTENNTIGFRLASSVPEPSRALLLIAAACGLALRRRRLPFAL